MPRLVLLLIVCLHCSLYGQNLIYHSEPHADYVRTTCRMSDGCYLIGGYSTEGNCLTKINSAGTILWSYTYTSENGIPMQLMTETTDGSIAVAGSMLIDGWQHVTYSKIDADGNLLWTKRVSTLHDGVSAICATNDNGFVITGSGCTTSNFAMKIDANGNRVWAFDYVKYTNSGSPRSIIAKADGNFIISGCDRPDGESYSGIMLFEINASGLLHWYRTIDLGVNATSYTLYERPDGKLLISGTTATWQEGTAFLMCTDAEGYPEWVRQYTSVARLSPLGQIAHADGSYTLAGRAHYSDDRNNEFLCLSVDSSGIPQWATTGGNWPGDHWGHDELISIHPFSSSAYVVFGHAHNGIIMQKHPVGQVATFCDPDVLTVSSTALPFTTDSPETYMLTIPVWSMTDIVGERHDYNLQRYEDCTGELPAEDPYSAILKMYPNPASDHVTVAGMNQEQPTVIRIFSSTGQMVYYNEVYDSWITIETSRFARGNYVLMVEGSRSFKLQLE